MKTKFLMIMSMVLLSQAGFAGLMSSGGFSPESYQCEVNGSELAGGFEVSSASESSVVLLNFSLGDWSFGELIFHSKSVSGNTYVFVNSGTPVITLTLVDQVIFDSEGEETYEGSMVVGDELYFNVQCREKF